MSDNICHRSSRRRRCLASPFVVLATAWLASSKHTGNNDRSRCCSSASTARATATSTTPSLPSRLPSFRDHPTKNNKNNSSSQRGWYDGSSSDDDQDEIESSSEDESLWGPPMATRASLFATATAAAPLHTASPPLPTGATSSSSAYSSLLAATNPSSSSGEHTRGATPTLDPPLPPSPPLQTLQKLQNMLDETDYLTSSAARRQTAATPVDTAAATSTTTPEPPPMVVITPLAPTPPDVTVPKNQTAVPARVEPQPRLWTSQDRGKYKRQQLKSRRPHGESASLTQSSSQQLPLPLPPPSQPHIFPPPRSPPIHPFSDDERDQLSDDTDDGLGYSLPNVPVYYSDAEEEEGESEGEGAGGPIPEHRGGTVTSPESPGTLSVQRGVPANATYQHPGFGYQAQQPPPPPHNYYIPPGLVAPQPYPPVLPEDGVRPQQYYPPYLYPPGSFPYMYPSYGTYGQPPFPSQYGAWNPLPPGFPQQRPPPPPSPLRHPFQAGSLTRPYYVRPPPPRTPLQTTGPTQDSTPPTNATTLLANDASHEASPPSSTGPTNLQQPQSYSSVSSYLGPVVPYDVFPSYVVTPENPQSLAEASSRLNLESIEKISLLLVTAALACYAGVSPRTLPLTEYNLRFYENLRLVSLAWIAPAVQFLSVLDARENDINALVNTFFVSFTLGYLLTFAAEIAVTTLVRLVAFRCFEPKIFVLTPAVPVPVLPWVLRDVQYRPKRITLFAADFATSCVACPIIEEYLKLRVLQWTTSLPRNFNWVTRVSAKNTKKKRTVAEAVPRHPGQTDVLNANKYVTHMLAVSLGLKLCDAGRRILLYTKRHQANKTFFAIFRGIFPIQELCGTMTALALAKRDLLGFPTPLWKMLAPSVVIHGMANYRGMKPIFKWNSATPWSEMQLYPLNFADSSTLPQLLSKGFGKFMWFVILGRVAGYCIKNYYLVNRQAVKRTTTYAGKHAAFSAELATAEVLKKQKQK